MADGKIDLTYHGNTTERDKKYDAEHLLTPMRATFPELPEPINHMYVRIRDLNSNSYGSPHIREFGDKEDLKPKPAIEAGIKGSF